jgi:ABC-type Fe3+ transport system permease subunit
MTTTSKIATNQSQTLNKTAALLAFILSIALGVLVPIIAIPWMFFLAYLGLDYRKELKGTFHWWLDQGFMVAAIVLGVGIFVALAFVLPWTSKPLR